MIPESILHEYSSAILCSIALLNNNYVAIQIIVTGEKMGETWF
jgi:hypothetical protein